MNVTILHQTDPHFIDYQTGDRLERVFEYQASNDLSDHRMCEWAFETFNAPRESLSHRQAPLADSYRARQLRSLSIGDVVSIESDGVLALYACGTFGWATVDGEPNVIG